MEKGWLKSILEHAIAERETWPAWQRGFEVEEKREQARLPEPDAHDKDGSEDHEAAA